MNNKAINFDHNTGTIYTTDDSVVRVGKHGALKVGDGEALNRYSPDNAGAIRFKKGNAFTESYYEMHDGTEFQRLVQPVDPINAIIFAIIFS